jgi:riboflavin synthase
MFTGITTDIGTVRTSELRGDLRLTIASSFDMATVDLGSSIACSGVCFTVVDKADDWFAVDVSGETLSRTAKDLWREGARLNLERSLRIGDELGGHIVSGHIDGVAEVIGMAPHGGSIRIYARPTADTSRAVGPRVTELRVREEALGGGGGVVGHGDAKGPEIERLLDILENPLLLADHVEVVVGARVLDKRHVRAARLHVCRHLAAILRRRPVVRAADEQEQRPHHHLLRVITAAAGIHGDGGGVADLGKVHTARASALEGGPIDDRHREHPPLRPAERGHALRNDEGLPLEILEGADGVVEALSGGGIRLAVGLAVGGLLARAEAVHHEGNVAAIGEPAGPRFHLRRDPVTAVEEHEGGKGPGSVGFGEVTLDAVGIFRGGALEGDRSRTGRGDDERAQEQSGARYSDHPPKYSVAALRYNHQRHMTDREWPEEAREQFERGYEAQMAGRLEEAIEHYRRSLAVHPTAEAHTFLGWALSFQGKHEEAIAACKRAIAVDPTFGNPYNDIGVCLIELGRPEEAVEWLERAKIAPRYEPRHYPFLNLARVYVRQHKVREAIRELEGAISFEPHDTAARQELHRLIGLLN